VPPLELPVAIPAGAGKTFVNASLHDLASHPWAGQRVYIRLTAADHAGQRASTKTMEAVLPERTFIHPVSKELVKWRKSITANPAENAKPALESVTNILGNPQSFNGEPLVHLTLSTVKYRLAYEPAADAAHTVPDLLWHAAVRIEDGNLVSAEQRLVDAEKALRDAIERGASAEEINRLVDELKQAAADYAKALAEKNPDQQNGFTNSDMQRAEDVAAKAEEVRQMSEMGAADAAKKALQELQEQLQALRDGQQNANDDNPDVKKSQQMMQEMRDLTKEQSDLLNESFDQAKKQAQRDKAQQERLAAEHAKGMQMPQRGKNNQSQQEQEEEAAAKANTQTARAAADKQDALRKKLNELMQKMEQMTGQKSEGMGEAESAMTDARDNLNAGAWKEGADGQSKALSKMQQSMAQAQEQLMQSLFDKGLGGVIQLPGPGQFIFSPLGARDGRQSGEHVDVPMGPDTEGMAQRVRVILEEIRSRASDRTRPEAEQEYLRRLMKQF